MLALLGVAIFVIGSTINSIVNRMNNTITVELCNSHLHALEMELDKNPQLHTLAVELVSTGDSLLLGHMYTAFLHGQFTGRSYAIVLDTTGRVLFHPDSSYISTMIEPEQREIVARVVGEKRQEQATVDSEFLGVDVERIYYPPQGDWPWVVAISVPHMTIAENVSDFHRYALTLSLVALGLFAGLLVLAQFRWRREYELRREAEQQSRELQLQQVIEQINPHFLFNSLNSLYSLINTNTALAREFVLKLSGVYRYVLERRSDTLATLDSEIEFTMKYYFLQKIRFEQQIEIVIDIDPALRSHRIPSMGLQTIVENAIKHNKITPPHTPLLIKIYTQPGDLIIENNYNPRPSDDDVSMGVGLQRLRSIYNYFGVGNIEVTHDSQTFRCRLPLLPPVV